MFNFDRPHFSIMCTSSRSITINGMTMGYSSYYSNIDGLERNHTTLNLPFEEMNESLDEQIHTENINHQKKLEELNKKKDEHLRQTKSKYLDKKKDIDNNYQKVIMENKRKKEELEQLEDESDNMSTMSEVSNAFIDNEKKKIEEKLKNEKKKIDEKYKLRKTKLKMDKSDKEKIEK